MLTVHHLGLSQSERIIWLCEELEIPYTLKRYDRDQGLAPAAYKAIHPLGTAPIITDGDLVLPESGAIMEYILVKYGRGRLVVGPDAPNFTQYLFWFHFANGTMMPSQMTARLADLLGLDNPRSETLKTRALRGWRLLEDRLSHVPYLAGQNFTAADIIMFFPLTTLRLFVPRDISGFPSVCAYLKRVGERPAYRRAMKKGDPELTPLLT